MTRLLLDENFPGAAAALLAAAGHDVLAVSMAAPGLADLEVLALARAQGRELLTFDADFGDLIFLRGAPPPPAVLYFRLHPLVVSETTALALAALATAHVGCLVVVTREGLRQRPFSAPLQQAGPAL